MVTKMRRCNKARFLSNSLKKTLSSGKSLISTYSFLGVVAEREWVLIEFGREVGWGGGGRLFEAGHLLTFLLLGWAPIRGGC